MVDFVRFELHQSSLVMSTVRCADNCSSNQHRNGYEELLPECSRYVEARLSRLEYRQDLKVSK